MNYRLIHADGTVPPTEVNDVTLLWTHPPAWPLGEILESMRLWSPAMSRYSTIIIARKDFEHDGIYSAVERAVLEYTQEGDIVCDPFCGTSTTGLAALSHGRRYIGIDNSYQAIQHSEKRLRDYA